MTEARATVARSQRVCRRCGCTDADCSGCIERTGAPCHWVADDLCSACVGLTLPAEMTPAIAEVLGIPNFQACTPAHLFRADGAAIKHRAEDEQAFVLWRFLHLAILHGDQWRRYAADDIAAARERVKAKAPHA